MCERDPGWRKLWGCEAQCARNQRVELRPGLVFDRCPIALLRADPNISDWSEWARWAHYHHEQGDLIEVWCDGAHLSALGHDVLRIWITCESDARAEAMERAQRNV